VAFAINSINYCGGSRSLVEDLQYTQDWLVVCLLGDSPTYLKASSNYWNQLEVFAKPLFDFISIEWQDMSSPPRRAGFWLRLHEMAKDKNKKHVLFYCEGGHGRTGTALASMLAEVCGMKGGEATEYVRKEYCKEAIETKSQESYINALTKKESKKK
jgi:protein-tyrosine phosphatase